MRDIERAFQQLKEHIDFIESNPSIYYVTDLIEILKVYTQQFESIKLICGKDTKLSETKEAIKCH